MRRFERNFAGADSRRAATALREKFIDAPASQEETMRWKWPREMQEVGHWEAGEGAVCYASNKWQKNPSKVIDYKHLAEGPQRLLVLPGFLRDYHRPGSKLHVTGPLVELDGPMPDAFAVLAPILGIQARLYDGGNEEDPELPEHSLYQINIANATLGAAKHPRTGQTFLFVYTEREGPLCVITGDILDVQKDGIVG
jgi:hypothetical protein